MQSVNISGIFVTKIKLPHILPLEVIIVEFLWFFLSVFFGITGGYFILKALYGAVVKIIINKKQKESYYDRKES